MSGKKKSVKKRTFAAAKPTVDEFVSSRSELNQTSADFLKIDVATALTFTGIALETDNAEKRDRNRRSARKAYDTVLSLVEKVPLTPQDVEILQGNLQLLRSQLVALGEIF